MKKVVGIGFKDVGKIYWFNPGHLTITKDSYVVVETVRGLELGQVVCPPKEVDDSTLEHELKDVIRVATQKDIKEALENQVKEGIIERISELSEKEQIVLNDALIKYNVDIKKKQRHN